MRPGLESVGSIAPNRIAGRDGHMDPLVTALGEAPGKTRELNKSKYMGHPQRVDSRVAGGIENSERATSVQMGVKTGGPRETLKILTANSAKLAIGVTPGAKATL
jgi:hypothetical protein